MKPVVVAGAALLAFVVLAMAFDPQWCIGLAREKVYGPPPEPVSVALEIGADGSVSIDGERVRDGMATKTQVTDGAQTISGVLAIRNQDQPGVDAQAPTKEVLLTGQLQVQDITMEDWSTFGSDGTPLDPYPSPPGNNVFVFMYTLFGATEGAGFQRQYVYFNADTPTPWDIELPFRITWGARRLTRTETTSYGEGRDGKPVYAREVSEADAWIEIDHPWSFDMEFGSLSASGTQWFAEEAWQPSLSALSAFQMNVNQYTGTTGCAYVELSLDWSLCELDFSGMGKTVSNLRFSGSGDTISMDLTSGFLGSQLHEIRIGSPILKDFSAFAVVDRDGNLLPDLLINGGFKADKRFAWTAACPLVPTP